MIFRKVYRFAVTCLVGFTICCVAQGQQNGNQTQSFSDWLNQQLVAKINQRSNTKQTEAPSQSSDSTSLVDQSSATDLVSAALNLAGVSSNATDTSSTPKSASVTASAYSLYALFKQKDPLDAEFYNANSSWRRVSLTLGTDNGSATSGSAAQRATIAGIKILLFDKRGLSLRDPRATAITTQLQTTSVAFGHIEHDVTLYLLRNRKVKASIVESTWKPFLLQERARPRNTEDDRKRIQAEIDSFDNGEHRTEILDHLFVEDPSQWRREEREYLGTEFQKHLLRFNDILKIVGDDGLKDIYQIIDNRVGLFSDLEAVVRAQIESIRRAPQFSVAFTSTTRAGKGVNEYVAESIFDYGVANRINLTLNNTFDYKDSKMVGGISRGSKFVGDVQFQLTPEKRLSGRGPVTFDVGAEGDWMSKASPTYKGQLKVKIPIADGIDLPISVTFANRTDLVNERDVVGKFGFTFDTAKLFSFLSK